MEQREHQEGPPVNLWPLYLATLMTSLARGATLLVIPLQALSLGGIFSGFAVPGMLAVGSVVMNLPAAFAVTRFGARVVMYWGLSTSAVGAAFLAVSDSVAGMALAALLSGLGTGVWGAARLIYLTELVPTARRGRAVAPVGGMYRIGMFVGPALGGIVAQTSGRTAALRVAAALIAVALLVIAGLGARPGSLKPAIRAGVLRRLGGVLTEHARTFATAGVAMGALALLRAARLLLLPVCGSVLGLGEAEIGFIKSASMFADMLLFYPVGWAMDRFGRKHTALPCFLLLSLGVGMIGWAPSAGWLLTAGLIAGLGNGLGSGINMTLAGDFAPPERRADFVGMWRLLSDAGAALSPFIMGAVARALLLSASGLVAAAVGVIGGLVLALSVPETLSPRSTARSGAVRGKRTSSS